MINDVLTDLSDLGNILTSWKALYAPLNLMVKRYSQMNRYADGFLLDSFRDEFDKTRRIRFRRRNPLGCFFERVNTPFR